MGGKSKAPPPPDYSQIASASKEAAETSAQVAREQLAWAKEQYAKDREVSDAVIEDAMTRSREQDILARKDRQRYEDVFQPMEQQLVDEANTYNTEARREQQAGKAQADVSQQFEAARNNAMQELESYGVDPTQTRAGALDISTRTQEAAARAGAGNQARERVENTGRALRSEAINVGRGLPGQAAASLNAAIQSGNQAVNSGIATTGSGASTMGTGTQWSGLANQSLGTWSNALTSGYNNQLNAFKANQSNSSGLGSMLGLGASMLGSGGAFGSGGALAGLFLSDERAKEDITPVGKTDDGQTIYKFRYKGEEGFQLGLIAQEVEKTHPGAVDEGPGGLKMVDYDRAVPDGDRNYDDGGEVPQYQSPSSGAVPDDVEARLSVGEFVIPEDVVRWKGEEWMNKLVTGARKAKETMGMSPEYGALPA